MVFIQWQTDLRDTDISFIIKANKQRWEIEENFEIMKSELKARPVYVSTEDVINGYLLICFIALLLFQPSKELITKKISRVVNSRKSTKLNL